MESDLIEKDNGWAWIIAGACCIGNFLTLGFSYATGIYYVIFLDAFNETPYKVSWIASINLGTLCMIGPLMSISVNRFGPRITMFCGAIVVSAGLAAAAFASSIYMLYVTFGVVAGAGTGFVYLTACAVIPMFFEKYRSGVSGVVIAASALGHFVYPFVIPPLAEHFGWRGSLLICSAMCLHTCIAAMLIKPRTRCYKVKMNETENVDNLSKFENPKSITKADSNHNDTIHEGQSMMKITLDLFCDLRFNILFVLTGFYMTGSSVVFTYLAGYAKTFGVGDWEAELLVSVMGGFSLGGRVILGLLGHVKCINSVILLSISYGLTGVGMVIAAVYPTFTGCLLCAAMFGFFYAATGPVYFEVMCRLFDPKRFSVALGYGMLIIGIGLVIGGPLGGWLFESTSFFPAAFYFAGTLCLISGMLGVLLYIVCFLCCIQKKETE